MAEPNYFYIYLRKQIPILSILSLFPGLGYIFLGYLNDLLIPALLWYLFILFVSVRGHYLYFAYDKEKMSKDARLRWYIKLRNYYYMLFSAWTAIFVVYVPYHQQHLNDIAIFTQIGASVVASALLFYDKRLFYPILAILILPLIIYFFMVNEWYAYILGIFSIVLGWVLLYATESAHKLLRKTKYQASHDALTGFYNRSYMINALQDTINSLEDEKDYAYLFLIDLDHFKTINDTLGHDVGDLLLQEVAERMQRILGQEHLIARLGGDEFVVLSNRTFTKERARKEASYYAYELLESLKQTYHIQQQQLYISASIGISIIDNTKIKANDYIKEADIAMYQVKASGRDGLFLFNEEMSQRVEKHMEIESMLHFALGNDEICLYFQPQFDTNLSIVGAEVLVRWRNDRLGFISPAEFIPLAEQTGHMTELGNFILENAFKTLAQWESQGITLDQFSINISMRQFFHHNFISDVRQLCNRYLNDRLQSKLIFEVTETLAAEDIKKMTSIMEELKHDGIRFSLDDFGTGYSSLSYLRQMPIDELKIDRSFVSGIEYTQSDKTLIQTIINMAQTFDFSVVAEGVETQMQCDFLIEHDCDLLQGYFLSSPLPKEGFESFYKSSKQTKPDTIQGMYI